MKAADGLRCAICGEPADYQCDARHARQFIGRLAMLHRGDVMLGGRDELRRLHRAPRYRIVQVETIPTVRNRGRSIAWAYVTLKGDVASTVVKFMGRRRLRLERLVPCGTAVCFRHVREIDDDVHQCCHCAGVVAA